MEITFRLNGEPVTARAEATCTLLDWLREERRLTGTKEGCNEGDCGACTVMVIDAQGQSRALNACILFLPQLQGKHVRTVEGVSGPDGQLHPVQQAMIDHHGSQCGFCTPGFIMSMATAHLNGQTDFDDALAGNLCRCTGYAPIIRAAQAAASEPVPAWLLDTENPASRPESEWQGHDAIEEAEVGLPTSSDELATWYVQHPDATLVAGATDIGLWVTKGLRQLSPIAFLAGCADLNFAQVTDSEIRLGAMLPMADLRPILAEHHPSFAELLRRFASEQIRGAATIGGNVANGSPIGDSPPALIALGAKVHLRKGHMRRALALEDYFIAYGKQDREPGEFLEAISIPRQPDTLHCYKLSKRFDQDISALCGCFNIRVDDGLVSEARIAFGGMAAVPKRASRVEAALAGQPWTEHTVAEALPAFAKDYTPIDDMRASARYRLAAAQNMLRRCFADSTGVTTSVLEVGP